MEAPGRQKAERIAERIGRPFPQVEHYLRERTNWPLWASGLAAGIERADADWVVRQEGGPARLRFLSDEDGIHDHLVTLPDGSEVRVPLRAVPIGEGTEVVLTLIRQPGMSDAIFARDADWMRRDLRALKRLLEAG